VVIRDDEARLEFSGHEDSTSANRLHLVSILKGLESIPVGRQVHVYTPSDYATQGLQHWVKNWAAQGWRTKDDQPVKHREVWQSIVAESKVRAVNWHVLKGEARPAESRQAEELARLAARG
jgi:ribonuclease HI